MNSFERTLRGHGWDGLRAAGLRTLQVNLGLRCNLRCSHCHVDASLERTEVMTWSTMEAVLRAAAEVPDCLVDLTGGAPELNPSFRRFVKALRQRGHPVRVRTNLAVFFEPGLEDLPHFYRDCRVALVASLPCYLEENVRKQRGEGVYAQAVEALCRLNELGYGVDAALGLDLVYNPGGPFLPPSQAALEDAYRRELRTRFGLRFHRLLALANMPLGRFRERLEEEREAEGYHRLLRNSFNPNVLPDLMCRHQVSVGWDGALHDCDFNLAVGLSVDRAAPRRIGDFDVAALSSRRIVTGEHCFGCTAGSGSSCGGSLASGSPLLRLETDDSEGSAQVENPVQAFVEVVRERI